MAIDRFCPYPANIAVGSYQACDSYLAFDLYMVGDSYMAAGTSLTLLSIVVLLIALP
ncbi:hypothetical protein ABDK09_13305 [Vibrio sp. CDRSL-10 TSBA]